MDSGKNFDEKFHLKLILKTFIKLKLDFLVVYFTKFLSADITHNEIEISSPKKAKKKYS